MQERYELNDRSMNVMRAKTRMCKVIGTMNDVRLDYRISRLLYFMTQQDESNLLIRSGYAACEVNTYRGGSLFAAMPPLEAFRLLSSFTATGARPGKTLAPRSCKTPARKPRWEQRGV